MTSNQKVRAAIIGVGNCASSLVQGVHYYRDAQPDDFVPGLMHVNLGGYHIHDIEFTAAFDIDKNKVGKDLSEAIYTSPNNTYRFADVPHTGSECLSRHDARWPGQIPLASDYESARSDRRYCENSQRYWYRCGH